MTHTTFPINSGQLTILIDAEDLPRVTGHGWCLNTGSDYVVANIANHLVLPGARWACFLLNAPPKTTVIHLNDDKLDYRRANLLLTDHSLALQRQTRRRVPLGRGSSRFRGVQYHKATGRWKAMIGDHGTNRHLGYFDEEIDAADAYDQAALHYYGIHARLNFPIAAPTTPSAPLSSSSNPSARPTRLSSSQYRGVHFVKVTSRWRATIHVNSKRLSLGCFPTGGALWPAAAHAYDQAALTHHGIHAHLNFPL